MDDDDSKNNEDEYGNNNEDEEGNINDNDSNDDEDKGTNSRPRTRSMTRHVAISAAQKHNNIPILDQGQELADL